MHGEVWLHQSLIRYHMFERIYIPFFSKRVHLNGLLLFDSLMLSLMHDIKH